MNQLEQYSNTPPIRALEKKISTQLERHSRLSRIVMNPAPNP